MNSDLIVEVSRDNGANWVSATMEDEGTFISPFNQWSDEVSFTNKPSGNQVIVRITSQNNVQSILNGVSIQLIT